MPAYHTESPSKIRFTYERYMLAMGVIGQSAFYFQALKIYSHKSAQDVSLIGSLFAFISVTSWLIYGILLKNKVLILSNIVAVIGAGLVLAAILHYQFFS